MESCSKTSAGAMPVLPDDPVVEILSRVPAKSVCRFKCVSKSWRDLIDDPDNRKKLRQAMQGLFVQTWEISEDDENDLVRVSFNFIDLKVGSVPLDIDPCFSFLTEMTGMQTLFFKDSCNGLILFRHYQETDVGVYIVCNPTTKQWSAVPACGSDEAGSRTYLAFDPAMSSQFHLIELQTRNRDKDILSDHVYSSETGIWSQNQIDKQKEEQGQLEGWHHQFTLSAHSYDRAFVNGFLHLIVWGANRQHILVVDIQGKARRIITIPGMADGRQRGHITCYLGQSQGHLQCMTIESTAKFNAKLSTWVLQDYDTQEWVLKSTVNSLDVIGGRGTAFGEVLWGDYRVVDFHQDSNVVFFITELTRKLIAYDMDRKEASVIATFEDDKGPWDFSRYVPYFAESPYLTNKH